MKGMKPDPLASAARAPSWSEQLAAGVASTKRSKGHPVACQGVELTFGVEPKVRRRLNAVVYVTREHVERVLRSDLLARLDAGERVTRWANEYWLEGSKS